MLKPEELSPEAQKILDRLKAAKADQRNYHAETIEFLQAARAVLVQLCQVSSPEHLPGRYRSRQVVRNQAQALIYHVADLEKEINPE
jgi:uncharacterized protein (DUF58 family)